jgi:hypothetical protein
MSKSDKPKLWQRIKISLRDLKSEMEKNSVANAGPSKHGYCHMPEEELEKKKSAYKEITRHRGAETEN